MATSCVKSLPIPNMLLEDILTQLKVPHSHEFSNLKEYSSFKRRVEAYPFATYLVNQAKTLCPDVEGQGSSPVA